MKHRIRTDTAGVLPADCFIYDRRTLDAKIWMNSYVLIGKVSNKALCPRLCSFLVQMPPLKFLLFYGPSLTVTPMLALMLCVTIRSFYA